MLLFGRLGSDILANKHISHDEKYNRKIGRS